MGERTVADFTRVAWKTDTAQVTGIVEESVGDGIALVAHTLGQLHIRQVKLNIVVNTTPSLIDA